MHHLVGSTVAMAFTLLALSAVAAISAGAATVRKYTVTTSQSENVAIRQVHWTSNVSTSFASGSWTFASDGLPTSNFVASHYAVPSDPFNVSASGASVITTSTVLKSQNYDYTLPLRPSYSKKVTATNQGPIGFLLDGGALYNPYEANHSTVATSDNFVVTVGGVTASFIDSCDGHPGPGGQYHYHGLPSCLVSYATGSSAPVTSVTSTSGSLTTGVQETTVASRRPLILGFAFDGYGIYDNVAMNATTVPVSALDACNGIFSPVPGYPQGIYHYVLENVKGVRSSIGCYHGVVSSAYTRALQNELSAGGTRTTISPLATKPRADANARSLAANASEDTFLLTMLRVRDLDDLC
jgi:hypothetical protein